MSKEAKQYTPAEFIEKLKSDAAGPKPNVFVGMLKTAGDDQHLMFAHGVSCAHWATVPVDRIESIEQITVVPCKDHAHPLVRLTLKAPDSAEAKMYAALAQSSAFTRAPAQPLEGMALSDPMQLKKLETLRNNVTFANSGPEAWFPCWSHCMDDLIDFAIEQPPEQFKFWTSLAYQLCGQICP